MTDPGQIEGKDGFLKVKFIIGLDTSFENDKKEIVVDLKQLSMPRLDVLLKKLADRYGTNFKEIIYHEEGIDPALLIILNDRIISKNDVKKVALKDGDELKLGITVSGG